MKDPAIPLWCATSLFGTLGLTTLILVISNWDTKGFVAALGCFGVAIACCPKIPFKVQERVLLGLLMLMFT